MGGFRVGILFRSSSFPLCSSDSVVQILDQLSEASHPIRDGQALTLIPFVRTTESIGHCRSMIEKGYGVEVASFDVAGVSFAQVTALDHISHGPEDDQRDFDIGMGVLLSHCHVLLILCANKEEVPETIRQLNRHENSCVSVAITSITETSSAYFEVDPHPTEIDSTEWTAGAVDRWRPG